MAELGRHGFLLPHHLPEVVPILVKALQYDEKRGNLIIGVFLFPTVPSKRFLNSADLLFTTCLSTI